MSFFVSWCVLTVTDKDLSEDQGYIQKSLCVKVGKSIVPGNCHLQRMNENYTVLRCLLNKRVSLF